MDGRTLVRRTAARTARSPAAARLVTLLERAARPRPGVLAVLTYHRVDEPARAPHLYPGLVSATPTEFEEQMRFLAANHRPLSLSELLAVRRGEAPLPPGSVMVTFDDAYRDVAERAWPIMQRHGVPLTLFVPTAYPDEPGRAFWWDRLYGSLAGRGPVVSTPLGDLAVATEEERIRAFRLLRAHVKSLPHAQAMALVDELSGEEGSGSAVLGWDELRRLAAEGVALAPHSRTHPLLDRLPHMEARREVLRSLDDLERETGPTPRVFAYPGGGCDDEVAAVLEEEGFELGFLTRRGTNDLNRPDWLRLRRINVGRTTGVSLIRLQLLPCWAQAHRRAKGRIAHCS
jgi:peptidoglycan/xylan/chitin deacetylase (PgdA/CDA1 family)